jgi:hypothetical protein
MNRMTWINYTQLLFSQLEHLMIDRQTMVSRPNYLKALVKIQPLLPLKKPLSIEAEKVISFE